jgi:hypothetical protein
VHKLVNDCVKSETADFEIIRSQIQNLFANATTSDGAETTTSTSLDCDPIVVDFFVEFNKTQARYFFHFLCSQSNVVDLFRGCGNFVKFFAKFLDHKLTEILLDDSVGNNTPSPLITGCYQASLSLRAHLIFSQLFG